MNHEDISEERYLVETSHCSDMNLALIRDHMFDNKQNKIEIPNGHGLMKPKQIIRSDLRLQFDPTYEYDKLYIPENPSDRRESSIRFYYLNILTKRNVVNMYLDVLEEDRIYIIDAYIQANKDYGITTASPYY